MSFTNVQYELRDGIIRKYLPYILILSIGIISIVTINLFSTPQRGISIELNKATFNQGETATLSIQNHYRTEITFGADYRIQSLRNGSWFEVSILDSNEAWPAINISLSKWREYTEEIRIEGLLPGKYRLIKDVWHDTDSKASHIIEFIIKK